MALFKPFRGGRQSLEHMPKTDGYAYFCVDDGSFWIDFATGEKDVEGKDIIIRKQISAAIADLLTDWNTEIIFDGGDADVSLAILDNTILA